MKKILLFLSICLFILFGCTKLEEKKVENALKDINLIATGIIDFITDYGVAPKQDGYYDKKSEFYINLTPYYLKHMPIKDPWGNNYLVYCGNACEGKYGITSSQEDDFLIICTGKDGVIDLWWEYKEFDIENGFYTLEPRNFDKDLVNYI